MSAAPAIMERAQINRETMTDEQKKAADKMRKNVLYPVFISGSLVAAGAIAVQVAHMNGIDLIEKAQTLAAGFGLGS